MATNRFQALENVLDRKAKHTSAPSDKISNFYGEMVFNHNTMQEYLTDEAYRGVQDAMVEGKRLDRKIADQVASAMKEWAISKKASHYCHWFQPLTGSTAEKHDAFFFPIEGGRAIERFEGSMLVQQEPDASSFPNGGIRNTFEARGYTAWDPSSPAYVIGKTLCIPTIFIAYTGEALDYKMPLLKALHAVDQAATEVMQFFDKNVTKVNATLGWEQEYFLVDKALVAVRPDLAMTGRALFGHAPAKGQQLDDHYFGSIPERITAFMRDFETEALRLGIPVTTRHNEVAPNQFECAPVFEETNLANDHNLLLMDVLEKTARKHDFRVLFHEKPFAGLNGSGKHNNWSLATNTGHNLLSPGKTPKTNMMFLAFFINTLKAIHDHADILRASIASSGNDHRLGANEAPPAIISAFIGSQLTQVLDRLVANVKSEEMTPEDKMELQLNMGKIPQILLDNTDRNRTSPFAFTGNKFEFRAVGASANCASAMIALNTIMASQLRIFKNDVDHLIEKGNRKDEAILKVLRDYTVASENIRFEGNGYGEEWVEEARKRGLPNLKDTPRALDALIDKKNMALFEEVGVLSKVEMHARHTIELENYVMKLQIESRMIFDIAQTMILPAAIQYQTDLANNVNALNTLLGTEAKKGTVAQMQLIREIAEHIDGIKTNIENMLDERRKANAIKNVRDKSIAYCDKVKPYFEMVRKHSDKLEQLVDDDRWPLPKLREMLFTR